MLKYLSEEIIPKCVIPAKAGIHKINHLNVDTHGFRLKDRRNDGVIEILLDNSLSHEE
jgi:hypothetical protein